MKTILVQAARYLNGQDTVVEIVYRGTGWKVNSEVKDYAILDIINGLDIIATHKSWDNVRFSDEIVSETTL